MNINALINAMSPEELAHLNHLLDQQVEEAMPGYLATVEQLSQPRPSDGETWDDILREREQQS